MKSKPSFNTLYGLRIFCKKHSIYAHWMAIVNTFLYVCGGVRHSRTGSKLAYFTHWQHEFVWLCWKQMHQLVYCRFSEEVAAHEMFAIVLNSTCCYHGNHRCCQISPDWNVKDFNFKQFWSQPHATFRSCFVSFFF